MHVNYTVYRADKKEILLAPTSLVTNVAITFRTTPEKLLILHAVTYARRNYLDEIGNFCNHVK